MNKIKLINKEIIKSYQFIMKKMDEVLLIYQKEIDRLTSEISDGKTPLLNVKRIEMVRQLSNVIIARNEVHNRMRRFIDGTDYLI